jgi:hypothetical protein
MIVAAIAAGRLNQIVLLFSEVFPGDDATT